MSDRLSVVRFQPIALPRLPIVGSYDTAWLPAALTSFVGRERQVAELTAMLREPAVRMVTLTGPGGVGKTRLAMTVAGELGGDFPDGIGFVSLAAIVDPNLVLTTVAAALGINQHGGGDNAGLVGALRTARALLVLDNMEQVLAAAPEVAELLQACPVLKILGTSRERLQISGERVYSVPPLGLTPDGGQGDGNGDDVNSGSLDSEAVRLFTQRAREAVPDFAINDEDRAAIAEICACLDGLPLAIELAAARTVVLPPRALLGRLDRSLPLLTGGPHDQPARQRTLRDAIEWSYGLLSPDEQTDFRCVSVFRGGFTLDAAEAVAGGEGEGEGRRGGAVLDSVGSLVAKSLLQREEGARGQLRFRMLETVREYGWERLAADGELDLIQGRHAAWCIELAEAASSRYFAAEEQIWLDALEAERANLREALTWLSTTGRTADLTRLCASLAWYWNVRGDQREGRTWLKRALASDDQMPPKARIEITAVLGMIDLAQDEPHSADDLAAESMALARAADDRLATARALILRAAAASFEGDYGRATAYLDEALVSARSAVDSPGAARIVSAALGNLGAVEQGQGRLAAAAAYYAEAATGFKRTNSIRGEISSLLDVADLTRELGDPRGAGEIYRRTLELAWKTSEKRFVFEAIEGIAGAASVLGDAAVAAQLFGAVARLRESTGITAALPYNREARDQDLASIRHALSDAALAVAIARGQAMPIADVVAEALALETFQVVPPPVTLTPREAEILPLLAEGQTDREIGAILFLSHRTVEHHVARLMTKFGVRTRSAAVEAARDGRLLPL